MYPLSPRMAYSNLLFWCQANASNWRRDRLLLRTLQWRHNEHDSVSNHQPHDCLLNRLFRRRSKKTSKLRVTGLCVGNSPGTVEFPAQMASYAENVSIWWRHHGKSKYQYIYPFGQCVEYAHPLPGRTNWRHHVHVSWLIVERTDLWGILNLNPRWTQAVNRQLHVCLNVVFVVNDCVMNPYPW